MIKNIIFDIGGVIFDESIEHVNKLLNEDSTSIYKKVYGKSFRECVLGNIDVVDYTLSFKDDSDYEKIKKVLDKNNLSITYPLLKDNYEYIKSLKDKGYNLYILSNIAKETYEYVNDTINIDSTFIGGVYSYKEHLVKPGKDIFELIVNRYNLNKSETIFFDDKQRNIDSANELGIRSYVFNNIKDIEDVL